MTDGTWQRVLNHVADQEAIGIGFAAYLRGNIPIAVEASRRSAEAGDTDAQYGLGVLLATELDPPDLAGARTWWNPSVSRRAHPRSVQPGAVACYQAGPAGSGGGPCVVDPGC